MKQEEEEEDNATITTILKIRKGIMCFGKKKELVIIEKHYGICIYPWNTTRYSIHYYDISSRIIERLRR
jgi:hypothetical protein